MPRELASQQMPTLHVKTKKPSQDLLVRQTKTTDDEKNVFLSRIQRKQSARWGDTSGSEPE